MQCNLRQNKSQESRIKILRALQLASKQYNPLIAVTHCHRLQISPERSNPFTEIAMFAHRIATREMKISLSTRFTKAPIQRVRRRRQRHFTRRRETNSQGAENRRAFPCPTLHKCIQRHFLKGSRYYLNASTPIA